MEPNPGRSLWDLKARGDLWMGAVGAVAKGDQLTLLLGELAKRTVKVNTL
jgi:hypothetical protein